MKKLISIISLALTIICANAGKIVTDSINSKVLKQWEYFETDQHKRRRAFTKEI